MAALAPSPRRTLKRVLTRLHRGFLRTCYPFGPDDLRLALTRLGLHAGDVVLVHSSYDQFTGFRGRPSDVIACLQGVVGPSGTVMMPTLPFTGTAVAHAARQEVFDVRRTPSRVGLLTELFRRSPGVVRSVHPTHPVAAWGARAAAIIDGHHLASTPCGVGSPFARLLDERGKILLLGVGVDSMTFFHTVEEILEPAMPFSPFTTEWFDLASRDASGRALTSHTRLFDPQWSRRRNIGLLVPALRQPGGSWRSTRIGHLDATLIDAAAVVAAARTLAESGVYCYDR